MRTVKPGDTGASVKAVQWYLTHNRFHVNFNPGEIDGIYGDKTRDAVINAKKWLGYPAGQINSHAGARLVGFLVVSPKHRLYRRRNLAWVIRGRARRKAMAPAPVVSVRTKIVRNAYVGLNNKAQLHYAQIRPYPKSMSFPMYTDCSGFSSLCYYLSGAPDPNGLGYSGLGYTGTQIANGVHIPISNLRPGDLVFYGFPVGHVAIYVGNGMVISHGSELAPYLLPVWYRSDLNHARSYIA